MPFIEFIISAIFIKKKQQQRQQQQQQKHHYKYAFNRSKVKDNGRALRKSCNRLDQITIR